MYRVGICGHFGFGKDLANGQTVKTKNITSELERTYGEEAIYKMDSSGGKKQIFKICIDAFNLEKKCKNVIMLPAHNGLLIFTPLFRFYNMLFKRKLHYVVIGGWLPEYLENHKITKRLLKGFDKIYVETSMMKSKLEKQGFKNILVMPNFKHIKVIESKEEQFGLPFKLCTFSRVLYEKGIEHAIEAVKLINQNGETNCTLDIYGEVDAIYKERFESVCQKSHEYIRYMGCADSNKSTDIISEYHALIFPTLYTDVEGFPGTLIDAFAANTPVIAFDWVNNDNIVIDNENGLLCSEKTVSSLANAIYKIMSSEELYQKLAEGCFKSAIKYSAENVIKILTSEI